MLPGVLGNLNVIFDTLHVQVTLPENCNQFQGRILGLLACLWQMVFSAG